MARVTPIPNGFTSVTPQRSCAGAADAIEFYKKAFGAVEESRLPGRDGKVMHAVIRINGAPIMLGEEGRDYGVLGPKTLKGSPVIVHLYVDDTDALVERAKKAGAKVTMPVAGQFCGGRYRTLEDPFGHHRALAQHPRS